MSKGIGNEKVFYPVPFVFLLFALVVCGYSESDLRAAYESGYQEGKKIVSVEAPVAQSSAYGQGFEDGEDFAKDNSDFDSSYDEEYKSDPSDVYVYWVPNGTRYHSSPDCRTLSCSKTINEGTLDDAFADGIDTPCKVCY